MSVATELTRLSVAMGRLPSLGPEGAPVVVAGYEVRVFADPCDGRTVRRLFVGSGVGADGRARKADVLDYIWDDPLTDGERAQVAAIPAEALAAIVDYVAALGA